jgi:hypothetical protein
VTKTPIQDYRLFRCFEALVDNEESSKTNRMIVERQGDAPDPPASGSSEVSGTSTGLPAAKGKAKTKAKAKATASDPKVKTVAQRARTAP